MDRTRLVHAITLLITHSQRRPAMAATWSSPSSSERGFASSSSFPPSSSKMPDGHGPLTLSHRYNRTLAPLCAPAGWPRKRRHSQLASESVQSGPFSAETSSLPKNQVLPREEYNLEATSVGGEMAKARAKGSPSSGPGQQKSSKSKKAKARTQRPTRNVQPALQPTNDGT